MKNKKEIQEAEIIENENKEELKVDETNKEKEENKVEEITTEVEKNVVKEELSKPKKEKKEHNLIKLFFTVVFAVVVGLIIVISILKFTPILSKLESSVQSEDSGKIITNTSKNTVYEKSSLAAAVENVYDSVVMVRAYKDEEEISTGTGFIYKKGEKYGYVMTNQHVVAEADEVKLVLSNDDEIDAEILSGDEYLDLAVMKISKDKVPQIATIGKSETMKIGDTVFTVGSPMGYEYRNSVTSGILSGKDRMVSVSLSNSSSNDWVMKVLQIDAAINPGNSGGPLLNVNGEVVGINSMKLVQDEIEGMGFAIPIEIAMAHVEELEKGKDIEWPLLGISMANVTDTSLLYKNGIMIDKNIKDGVVVVEISKGTGASKSDLKTGDVIIALNGAKVKDSAYLRYELYKNKPGDTIDITYIRDNKERTTKIELGKSEK